MNRVDAARIRALAAACRLPDRVIRPLLRVPAIIDGQPLDLRTRWFLTLLKFDRGGHERDAPAVQRDVIDLAERLLCKPIRPIPITTIDVPLAGRTLCARVYRGFEGENAPALLYVHGGGFVTGRALGYESLCSRIAKDAGCVVISLDYRLAPECPFPAAIDDVADTWRWLRAEAPTLGLDRHRLAVGGDSAGGNLSAVLSNEVRRHEAPLFQLLIYPAVEVFGARPSYTQFANGFYLTAAHADWFHATYAPDPEVRATPRACPIRAESPGDVPAILVTAGLDPLRDDGRAYVTKLREAGVPVDHVEARGLPHGFVTLDGVLPEADAFLADLCARVKLRW